MSFFPLAKSLLCAVVVLNGDLVVAAESGPASSSAAGTNYSSGDAKARFYAMRRQAVLQMDGDFFKAAKFTPEQEEKFIAVRIGAEDRVRDKARETSGSIITPSMIAHELDAAFAKDFSQDLARQYRDFVNTRFGREFVQGSDELQADDWLTPEEQEKLAQAWGPIVFEAMDRSYDKKFEAAPRDEKLAYYDRMMKECAAAAAGVLSPVKQAKLKQCFQAMREKTLAELDKPKAGE